MPRNDRRIPPDGGKRRLEGIGLDAMDEYHWGLGLRAKLLGMTVDEMRQGGLDPGLARVVGQGKQPRHPVQPLVFDDKDVLRFKENAVVEQLRNNGSPVNLNEFAVMDFGKDDWDQFGQIIGYSHSGAPSYVSTRSWNAAAREWNDRNERLVIQEAQQRAQGLETALPAAEDTPRAPKPRV